MGFFSLSRGGSQPGSKDTVSTCSSLNLSSERNLVSEMNFISKDDAPMLRRSSSFSVLPDRSRMPVQDSERESSKSFNLWHFIVLLRVLMLINIILVHGEVPFLCNPALQRQAVKTSIIMAVAIGVLNCLNQTNLLPKYTFGDNKEMTFYNSQIKMFALYGACYLVMSLYLRTLYLMWPVLLSSIFEFFRGLYNLSSVVALESWMTVLYYPIVGFWLIGFPTTVTAIGMGLFFVGVCQLTLFWFLWGQMAQWAIDKENEYLESFSSKKKLQ